MSQTKNPYMRSTNNNWMLSAAIVVTALIVTGGLSEAGDVTAWFDA